MHLFASPVSAARNSHSRLLLAGLGAFCLVGGLLVLAGWLLHLPTLIQVRPDLAPMQFNTALCFVLTGAAFCGRAWGNSPRLCLACSALVATVGGLTLAEYLFSLNLHIDELLMRGYVMTATSDPGRMSPVSALCFTLTGAALIILGLRSTPRWQALVAGSLGSIVVSIAVVALFGYASGLPGTYGWGQLTRVAAHTAVGLGIVGLGLFLAAWQLGTQPHESAPRWLPVPLALSVFTVTLILYFALESQHKQEISRTVKASAESVKSLISVRMEARVRSFMRMARRWEYAGEPTRAAWETDAADYVRDFPDLEALEWIDPQYLVRWIVPLAGNEGKINLDVSQEEHRRAAIQRAGLEHQPVITSVVTLFHGGLGFVIYVPIAIEGKSHGFIAAIFNAKTCFERYFPPAVAAGEAISLSEAGRTFYVRDTALSAAQKRWIVTEPLELHGATWEIGMWPTPALEARLDSALPEVVFGSGLLLSGLFAMACFFAQRYARLARVTARANLELMAALDQVKTLEGLLPICSCCKRVRDDTGYWNQIDTYIHKHTNASLSHGYCPECAAKTCREFGIAIPEIIQEQLDAGNFEAHPGA